MLPPDSSNLATLFQSFDRLRTYLEAYIQGKAENLSAEGLLVDLAQFAALGQQFHLSEFEQTILLLTVALELEPNFQALCAQVQGDASRPYATLGLALSIFPNADWSVLSPQNPLHHWQLIQTEPGPLLTQSQINIDRRILCYLLGEPAIASELANLVLPAVTDTNTLPPSYRAIAAQVADTWSAAVESQPWPLIFLTGIEMTVSHHIAQAACDRLGLQLWVLPAAVLPTSSSDLSQLQRLWQREAILTHSALLLDCETAASTEPGQETAIALFLEALSTPVIISSRDRQPRLRRPLLTFTVPPLPHTEQTALWQAHLGETADLNGTVNLLASQFQLSPVAIQSVCEQFKIQNAKCKTGTEGASGQSLEPGMQTHLWTLCRLQARPSLEDLAQRIEAVATWEDLVLPDRQRQLLRDMAAHLNYRAQVYQSWGFAAKGDRGRGISALFYGDSGTGKTMAAEVLARACCLDLYRIDLSMVVSKYIGETEKNLRRIFDAAETGGVILLFDEADALFGKRSEVKDSHDRHANIEVSYLLQRMESYQGLAILTSNLKDSLDKAFLRRLRFMVPFPFPDAAARSEIWRRVFPAQTPIQDLDYDKLGQLKVAGGNIRNVALNAAFLAAQSEQPVSMNHIRQAAQREYLKLERLLTTEEIRGWERDSLP